MQRRYRKPKPKKETIKKFRTNQKIRSPFVLLVDDEGNKKGQIKTTDALATAQDKGLDLVEVSPKSDPPVAKIMDYGQYKYEMEKKFKKAKAGQKKTEVKSIRMSFRIKGKDLENKKDQTLKFLNEGHQVKINIILKGREKAHKNLALDNLKQFIKSLGADIKILQPISSQGGQITTTLNK